jgi:hypothetical protein
MAIKIDIALTAVPSVTGLPASIKLRQTIESNFPGGEAARVTYTIDGGGKVVFQGGGTTFEVAGVHVGNTPLQREDEVGLVWVGGTPSPAQIVINQEIVGVENTRRDSVVISIQ